MGEGMLTVLIIAKDANRVTQYEDIVTSSGHCLKSAETLARGYELCCEGCYDLILVAENELNSRRDCLAPFVAGPLSSQVVLIGGRTGVLSGAGARYQGLARCDAASDVAALLERLATAKEQAFLHPSPEVFNIYGASPQLMRTFEQLCGYARFDGNVLLGGSTGTGKELFARALHKMSSRSAGPMVTVDCAALPETLVESVIFGYNKGAFTGASSSKPGLIKLADRGTLFLDEVGEMPLHVQKKFLRVLQERRFLPVGGGKEVSSDFRLIAATNRDLRSMVENGKFREDLYYRLRTLNLELPALRHRENDAILLARLFLDKQCANAGQPRKRLSGPVQRALGLYSWPGNVRELINVIESAYALAWNTPLLRLEHLPTYIQSWLNTQGRFHSANDNLFVERRQERGRREADAQASSSRRPRQEEPVQPPADLPAAAVNALPTPQKAPPVDRPKSYREERRRILETFEEGYLTSLYSHCQTDISEACAVSRLSRPRLYALYKKHDILGRNS